MTTPILFLDDSHDRARSFLARYPDATWCETAPAAIEALCATGARWRRVCLDHDLGGEVYVDSSRPDTGMEVVRVIVRERPAIEKIIVHTLNRSAGEQMVAALAEAGYDVVYRPFFWLPARSRELLLGDLAP